MIGSSYTQAHPSSVYCYKCSCSHFAVVESKTIETRVVTIETRVVTIATRVVTIATRVVTIETRVVAIATRQHV